MGITSIRLFVEQRLEVAQNIALGEAQAHYLGTVMRAREGDLLRVFDGVSGEWEARVGEVGRKRLVLTPLRRTRAIVREPDCLLCFALLKRQKTDLVVEKATELGASVIQPVITARTQGDHVNLARLRAIAIEAAEQCERLVVPQIRAPVALTALLRDWDGRPLYVADERRTAAVLGPARGPAALLIGPEGGFTDPELDAIAGHPIVTRVSLGRRILRAETAAIAGLALMLAADEF